MPFVGLEGAFWSSDLEHPTDFPPPLVGLPEGTIFLFGIAGKIRASKVADAVEDVRSAHRSDPVDEDGVCVGENPWGAPGRKTLTALPSQQRGSRSSKREREREREPPTPRLHGTRRENNHVIAAPGHHNHEETLLGKPNDQHNHSNDCKKTSRVCFNTQRKQDAIQNRCRRCLRKEVHKRQN